MPKRLVNVIHHPTEGTLDISSLPAHGSPCLQASGYSSPGDPAAGPSEWAPGPVKDSLDISAQGQAFSGNPPLKAAAPADSPVEVVAVVEQPRPAQPSSAPADLSHAAPAAVAASGAAQAQAAGAPKTAGAPAKAAEVPSRAKAFTYGILGVDRPKAAPDKVDEAYTAGQWASAGLKVAGLIALLA